MVCNANIKLSYCGVKAGANNTKTNEHVYIPIRLNLQKQAAGQLWPMSHSLPTPGMNNESGWYDKLNKKIGYDKYLPTPFPEKGTKARFSTSQSVSSYKVKRSKQNLDISTGQDADVCV